MPEPQLHSMLLQPACKGLGQLVIENEIHTSWGRRLYMAVYTDQCLNEKKLYY
jgi:hypothetical protein